MKTATNPSTGERVYFDPETQEWLPMRSATNPETGERVYLNPDSNEWEPLRANVPKEQREENQIVADVAGGTVYRLPDGSLSFSSPNYSTSDQEAIARLMEGGSTPRQEVQATTDELTLDQAGSVFPAAQEIVRGAPFIGSWMDELLGITKGEDTRDAARVVSDAYQRQNPGKAALLNVTGGVASAAPLLALGPASALAGPTTALRGLLGGLLGGGVEGAVYGAGEGDETGRSNEALEGAAWGAGLGGGLGLLLPGAEKFGAWTLNKLRGMTTEQIKDVLGTDAATADLVRSAVDRGDTEAAAEALRRTDGMLGEATTESLGLLDLASNVTRGDARDYVREGVQQRVSEADASMRAAIDRTLGPAPQGTQTLAQSAREASAPQRKAAYDRAYATPIDYSSAAGRQIEDIVGRMDEEDLRKAIASANKRIKWEGANERQILASFDERGNVTFMEKPNSRQLDQLVRALSREAEASRDINRKMTPEGQLAGEMAGELRAALGSANEAYRDAVRIGGDNIREEDALFLGSNLLKGNITRDEVIQQMSEASADERAMAAAGLRSALDERINNLRVAATSTRELTTLRDMVKELDVPSLRTKAEIIMGPERAKDLFDEVDKQISAVELSAGLAQNSLTAARQTMREEVADRAAYNVRVPTMQDLPDFLSNNSAAARRLREKGMTTEAARVLTQYRGDTAAEMLKTINKIARGDDVAEAELGYIASLIANAMASSIYTMGRPN